MLTGMVRVIGYYVHHHGRGHVSRALAIGARLAEPITFFCSLPQPPELPAGAQWVQLPMDTGAPEEVPVDTDAGGRLHWAPLRVRGLAQRSATLLSSAVSADVRHFVVDMSVEVALLVRVAGFPVTVLAAPGGRADTVHQLGYDIAENIIAPWSAGVYRPQWLAAHADRTHFVGVISRFEGRVRPIRRAVRQRSAVLLMGGGGADIPPDAIEQLKAVLPQYNWISLGGPSWVSDPWPILASADLVITHGGQNAIADCAHAGAAVIVVPQDRPFGEQRVMAAALAEAGMAVVADSWPQSRDWPELASRAAQLGGIPLLGVQAEGASARAAAVIAA